MVIDLYFVGPSPPCRAVMMAAKHLNIKLNPNFVDLMKGEQKEEWFLKLNPQHCLPTICDNGYVLWERNIGEYLAPIMRDGKHPNDLDPEKGKKIKEALQILDDSLALQSYVAGNDITLADLSVLASLSLAEVFDYDMISIYKNVKQWSDRLKRDLPYYDEINKEPINMFKAYVKSRAADQSTNIQ
ncbi:unnamed protein product, partial [Medioppia subpectinata]